MSREGISFIQPRHSYAPEDGEGHIYMPTSLLTALARVDQAGGHVADFQDLNLRPLDVGNLGDVVGINLIGPPYIPIVRELIHKIGPEKRVVLGGQAMSGLDEKQFRALFGSKAINGNDDATLAHIAGVEKKNVPSVYSTSLVPAYERIDDADMYKYLSREFSFFLSQGCVYHCEFCAAQRSIRNAETGAFTKTVTESYRTADVIEKDLTYLIERAQKLGLSELNLYLSNLDLFQTPKKLLKFADTVLKLKESHPDFLIRTRGLSTVKSFIAAHQRKERIVGKMVEAGLHTIGFGVDGTPEDWAQVGKGHNSIDECIEAIRLAREEYDITPEILMVFGFPTESAQSLQQAVTFTADMTEKFNAIPRPYVAKDIVPGSDYWQDPKNAQRVATLIEHPEFFQAIDFAALPSEVSHPNLEHRRRTEKAFLAICNMPSNTTKPIYPISPEFDKSTLTKHHELNIGNYDN